jgi:hypothetical protein
MTLWWLGFGKDVAGEVASSKSTKPSPIWMNRTLVVRHKSYSEVELGCGQRLLALSLSWTFDGGATGMDVYTIQLANQAAQTMQVICGDL